MQNPYRRWHWIYCLRTTCLMRRTCICSSHFSILSAPIPTDTNSNCIPHYLYSGTPFAGVPLFLDPGWPGGWWIWRVSDLLQWWGWRASRSPVCLPGRQGRCRQLPPCGANPAYTNGSGSALILSTSFLFCDQASCFLLSKRCWQWF